MLKVPQTEVAFEWINRAVEAIAAATRAGTSFVFGYVGGGALTTCLLGASAGAELTKSRILRYNQR